MIVSRVQVLDSWTTLMGETGESPTFRDSPVCPIRARWFSLKADAHIFSTRSHYKIKLTNGEFETAKFASGTDDEEEVGRL